MYAFPKAVAVNDTGLVLKLWFRTLLVPFDQLVCAKLTPLVSLCDEIGIILTATGDRTFQIRETDPGFKELCSVLNVEGRAGPGWYPRVEGGELIELDLTGS